MNKIYHEIQKERINQDIKFGVQNHSPERWLAILMEEVGEVAKEICELGYCAGSKDAVYRSLVPHHVKCYREELIQVAAVAVAMVECLDRQIETTQKALEDNTQKQVEQVSQVETLSPSE